MTPDLSAVRRYVLFLAERDLCTTVELTSATLECTVAAACSMFKTLACDGYVRATYLAGFGNRIIYQPTMKSLPFMDKIPAALRSTSGANARYRGVLKAFITHIRPELAYLTSSEQAALRRMSGIPDRGHVSALMGRSGDGKFHIFAPLLSNPLTGVESAAARWLPLLTSDAAILHLITPAPQLESVRDALAEYIPGYGADGEVRAELAALQAAIAADRTGVTGMRNGTRLRMLEGMVAMCGEPELPWIGEVIGVPL